MKKIILSILPVFFFLNYSCKQENPAIRVGNDFLSTKKKDHFIVTSLGDSIQSGVPLRGKGKVIDPNSVSAPKMLAVGGPPAEAPIQINVKPLGQPQIITPPKNPRVFIIGEDGVPVAKTVPALGESVRAIQPSRKIAGKPLIKDEAITNIQIWNLDQGLNASSVKKMIKDSRSDIWMITDGGGISRFDGNYFTHYTINEGLPFNDPICMMEDSNGNIWIGGFQGLVRYDGNRFTHYTQKDGLEDVAIYAMMEDRNGSLWFAGHGHLTRFDPDQNTFTHFNTNHGFTQNLPIHAMKEDSHGNIWIGQVWGGLYLFEPSNDGKGGKISHFGDEQGFGKMFFSSILENKGGELWMGTSSGVYQINITSKGINEIKRYTMDQGLTNLDIFSMIQDRHGDIWLGTRNGLNRMHIPNEDIEPRSNGIITVITEEQGLSNNRVTSLLEDDHGNIWIGTRNGLNRYMEGRFSYIRNAELGDHPIHTILEDQQGHLWFGSSNTTATLFKLEENIHDGQLRQNLALFSQYERLGMPDVQSISADAKGRLWVGLYDEGGMRSYTPGNLTNDGFFTIYNFPQGLLTPFVQDIYVDSKENVWVGGVGGLTCFVPPNIDETEGRFIHFTREEGFPSYVVLSILEDSKENLWFGTQRGVSRYQPDDSLSGGVFTHYTSNEGLSKSWITSILEDSQGNIWFGSDGGGVTRLDPSNQKFIQFNSDNGLSHNIIRSLLEDDKGNIWIGTQKGLNMLTPIEQGLASAGDSGTNGYHIYTFNYKDGLKNVDFAKGICMDRNRRIWWGMNQGVTVLDLDQFTFSTAPPNLKMSTIEIEEAYIDYRRLSDSVYRDQFNIGEIVNQAFDSVATFFNYPVDLVLPYDLNHLTFRFTATEWSAPHKIEYSYWMEGLDKGWGVPINESSVEYRNLPHGRHTLKVRARGEAQYWSEPFEYDFRITPPWWYSPWAYFVYTLFAISSVFGILQWRTAFLRRRQKELEQTVKERTSEVVAQRDVISREKDRSEALLLNILPVDIADELKVSGESPARDFDTVTVLFTDFKGFTKISEELSAQELVYELNTCFKTFDEIVTRYKIEKIKTIGDAYMAAGGIGFPRETEPKEVVLAALEMQRFIVQRQKELAEDKQPFFEMRCGIHTGPVVAGIVGVKKFQYDIWGDTVNMAARMESSGEVGKVNISQDTYEYLKDNSDFTFTARGKVKAKNKGEIEMYYVNHASFA